MPPRPPPFGSLELLFLPPSSSVLNPFSRTFFFPFRLSGRETLSCLSVIFLCETCYFEPFWTLCLQLSHRIDSCLILPFYSEEQEQRYLLLTSLVRRTAFPSLPLKPFSLNRLLHLFTLGNYFLHLLPLWSHILPRSLIFALRVKGFCPSCNW